MHTNHLQQGLETGLHIKFVNNVIILMFVSKCFSRLIFSFFDITQPSCQLREIGGLAITFVIIMIGADLTRNTRHDSIHALYMIEK